MDEKTCVLIEQLKLAVELYSDENRLNWSKFRHGLYGLFLLGAAYSLSLAENSPNILRVVVPVLAIAASSVFLVALINGLRSLEERANGVKTVELKIIELGGVDAKMGCDLTEDRLWRRLKGTFYVGTGITIGIWLFILGYHYYY